MARGNDPGKEFNDRFYKSQRKGKERAARGEGHWRTDREMERYGQPAPNHNAGPSKPCAPAAIAILAGLGGLGWAFGEAVRYVS